MLPIIRFSLIFIIFLIISILIIKKFQRKDISKSKKVFIYFVIIVIIQQVASIPLENLFIKYDSTEKAFFCLGRGDCLGIEEGQESSLIIAENKSKQSYIYLDRENEYLKAPFFKPKRKVVSLDRDNGVIVTLIQEKNTQNYYIVLLATHTLMNNEYENYITDNKNSVFQRLLYLNEDKNNYFYLYSAYVENVDKDDYYVKINDNEYKVFK